MQLFLKRRILQFVKHLKTSGRCKTDEQNSSMVYFQHHVDHQFVGNLLEYLWLSDDFVSEAYLSPSVFIQFPFGFFEVVRICNVVLPMYFTSLRCFQMLHKLQNTHFQPQLQRNLIEKEPNQIFMFCKMETSNGMYPYLFTPLNSSEQHGQQQANPQRICSVDFTWLDNIFVKTENISSFNTRLKSPNKHLSNKYLNVAFGLKLSMKPADHSEGGGGTSLLRSFDQLNQLHLIYKPCKHIGVFKLCLI